MGVDRVEQDAGARPLTPAMRSRKLQALDFIKRYFIQWGRSPTLSEIAMGLGGISGKRAYDLVHELAYEQMIEVRTGKTRGIRLIDRAEELSEADVLLRLSAMGWTIGQGPRVILPPNNSEDAAAAAELLQALMEKGLPDLDFVADEDPVDQSGDGDIGPQAEGGPGGRAQGHRKGARRAAGGEPGGLGTPAP